MKYLHKKLNRATEICVELKHSYVGTEHLLLAILEDKSIKDFTKDYDLSYISYKEAVIRVYGEYSADTTAALRRSPHLNKLVDYITDAVYDLGLKTDAYVILNSILNIGEGCAFRVLVELGIDVIGMRDELDEILQYQTDSDLKALEKFSCLHNMCKEVKEDKTIVTGLDKELDELLHNLLRLKKPNAILIGEPGVGKTALVEKLAQAINYKEVPSFLQNIKIYQLSIAEAVAGTKYRGEFEDKVSQIINAVEKRKDIVLFIDEIHTLNGAGGAEGAIDAGNIFKPFLARGKIKIIGATTTDEYNKYIKTDKALARRFNLITLIEPTKDETINILNSAKIKYEKHFGIKISKKDIENIYKDSTLKSGRMPDIALDALEEYSVNKYYEKKQAVKC